MKANINIPFAYIASIFLYIYWAMGDPHITVWHWLGLLLFGFISRAVYAWIQTMGD